MKTLGQCNINGWDCTLVAWQYSNGRLAIAAIAADTGELVLKISVNVTAIPDIGPDEFVVNHDLTDLGWEKGVFATGLFDVSRHVDYGFVAGQPVWRVRS